jgi:hypothetical protein
LCVCLHKLECRYWKEVNKIKYFHFLSSDGLGLFLFWFNGCYWLKASQWGKNKAIIFSLKFSLYRQCSCSTQSASCSPSVRVLCPWQV